MKEIIKKLGLPVLTVLFVSIFPAVFLYCQNADEAGFGEILPSVLLFAGIGMAFFILFCFVTHSANKAGIAASLFILIVTNFAFLEALLKLIFPRIKYWHVLPLLFVIGLHIAFFVWRYVPYEISRLILNVSCAVFGGLILINAAMGAPSIMNYLHFQQQATQNYDAPDKTTVKEGKSNIYLIIFDEYASFYQMENYLNYENKPLKDLLWQHNFSISNSSHNESCFTSIILTNLVNLDYLVGDGTSASRERMLLRKNGRLFDLMREHGYDVKIYETGFTFRKTEAEGGDKDTTSHATNINGEDIQTILLQQTALYPLSQQAGKPTAVVKYDKLTKYLSSPENLPLSDTFSLIYYCFPHQPFYVDENGNMNTPDLWENWKVGYVGQYKYATKYIIRIVENILKNDPDSTIILQSDHGGRGGSTEKDYSMGFPYEVKTMPFNAVYTNGGKLDIEGLSSINTLRTVLNYLWDTDYEMIPLPDTEG